MAFAVAIWDCSIPKRNRLRPLGLSMTNVKFQGNRAKYFSSYHIKKISGKLAIIVSPDKSGGYYGLVSVMPRPQRFLVCALQATPIYGLSSYLVWTLVMSRSQHQSKTDMFRSKMGWENVKFLKMIRFWLQGIPEASVLHND